jgi:hypothetical protein
MFAGTCCVAGVRGAAAMLAPGGRFVLLDLRMPDNRLRHLAPALVWLVRPFAVSLEVAKRQPWESLRRHFAQYRYQASYLGIVYIPLGSSRTVLTAECRGRSQS